MNEEKSLEQLMEELEQRIEELEKKVESLLKESKEKKPWSL
jgi:uncharacterized protein YoxC